MDVSPKILGMAMALLSSLVISSEIQKRYVVLARVLYFSENPNSDYVLEAAIRSLDLLEAPGFEGILKDIGKRKFLYGADKFRDLKDFLHLLLRLLKDAENGYLPTIQQVKISSAGLSLPSSRC